MVLRVLGVAHFDFKRGVSRAAKEGGEELWEQIDNFTIHATGTETKIMNCPFDARDKAGALTLNLVHLNHAKRLFPYLEPRT